MKNSYYERFVDSQNAKLWTCTSGSGIPFLMFNGGPGCDDYLAPVAALIEDVCQVIRFEPRGCGRSVWDGNYSVETVIADAEAIRQEYELGKCIVGGHSFGPDLALAYALEFRENVIGLIAVAGGRIVNDRTWHATYKANLAEIGEELGVSEFHADVAVNRVGNESWREYIKAHTLLRAISELRIPATYIWGSEDIRPNWPTKQLSKLLPQGEYIEISGAPHAIWLTHAVQLRQHLQHAVNRTRQVQNQIHELR